MKVAAVSLACFLFPFFSFAQSTADPVQVVERLILAVCKVVPIEGSTNAFKVEGEAEVRLSGALDWLADAGLSGASTYSVEKYVGYMQSEVGARAVIEQQCRLQIYTDFAPIISNWIIEPAKTNSASTVGDGNITVQGNDVTIENVNN